MFDDIISEIFNISKNKDKKDVNQKFLKTTEELGELSQAILIKQEAHGTKYRNKDEFSVEEELADVFICLISLAQVLKVDRYTLADKINEKMKKWSRKIEEEK